ncbi:MAG: signal peptidase I [Candidatus Limnocylindrales bacterium]
MPASVPPAQKRSRRALGCVLEVVETLVLTLVLFWVIQSFVAQPFQVQQVSMLDTIQDGQYVLVDRLTPHFDAYHRGDIVVFNPPVNSESPEKRPFIKRIIGIAGDTVELRDGAVFVNNIALDEPYVYEVDGLAQPTDPEDGQVSWKVPAGMLFVMGDHRALSTDSRTFGPIAIGDVIGRAWLRYWPLADFAILPTDSHPELASPSPRPSASVRPSAKPSAKPVKSTPKPARTPKP